jgi:hypothetical protein
MTTKAEPAPELRRTPNGWLAVSPPGEVLQFAVAGLTQEQALSAYWRSYERWVALLASGPTTGLNEGLGY